MTEENLKLLEQATQILFKIVLDEKDERYQAEEHQRQIADWLGNVRVAQQLSIPPTSVMEKRTSKKKTNKWDVLTFTSKEILKMPKQFRKQFRAGKVIAHVRKKSNGVYEIRCQIDKQQIYAASKLLETAKEKFLEALNELVFTKTGTLISPKIKKSITLGEYMLKWLETVKKPMVKPITYKDYMLTFTSNIQPVFGERKINEISQLELQELMNSYTESGRNRTAQKIHQLLSAIFDYAVVDDLITKTPMQRVVLPRYEQERGVPLTREEERDLVEYLKSTKDLYAQAAVFLIYTGLRRSELASVVVTDGWITLKTSKQRKGLKEKSRAVPISPMLEPLLPLIDVPTLTQTPVAQLTKYFKRLCPNHHLHDTRHTFITRAQECGIARELVSLWAGHAADSSTTSTVYTHLGQNKTFQEKEMQKFLYEYPPRA